MRADTAHRPAPLRLRAWIPATERGFGKGTGAAMRPTARRSRVGAPPWKKGVAGGYRKL